MLNRALGAYYNRPRRKDEPAPISLDDTKIDPEILEKD